MAVFKTRAQQVADDLRRRILEGEFPGGAQLRQDALADDYEVSRIPVREALLVLEAEGLVEFHPHRGAFITELSVPKIEEIFNLRILLECFIFEQAIPKLTAKHIEEATKVLHSYDAALDSGGQIDTWSEFNFQFHRLLYAPAHLPETLSLITHLHTQADRYIRMQLLYSQRIEKAEHEHRKLLELAGTGDVDGASRLLRKHIGDACTSIIDVLKQKQDAL